MTARSASGWLLAGLLTFAALAGCGGGSGAAQTTAQNTTSASSVQQQARTIWLEYARCVRSHGFPAFPDPQINSAGKAEFPPSSQVKYAGQQSQAACGGILGHLPATAQGRLPVTPALLRQERLYAACLRRNGLADWPDPRPDGTFQLHGTPYVTDRKTPAMLAAFRACQRYDSFGGVKG